MQKVRNRAIDGVASVNPRRWSDSKGERLGARSQPFGKGEIDVLTSHLSIRSLIIVRSKTTPVTISSFAGDFEDQEKTRPARDLLATDIKVTGEPLDPANMGQIIKPRELVDIIELTPLNRGETILYNQLLAHAWNNILETPVHKVLKASLRGSHQSNDRLEQAFDTLMGAWAKVRARDSQTGKMAVFRVHLLGTNKEEEQEDGYFHYTFPPDLLAIIQQSKAWATIKTHIMYALRSKYRPGQGGEDMRGAPIGALYDLDVFVSDKHLPIIDYAERVGAFPDDGW